MFGKLEGIEKEMFSTMDARDQTLNSLIKNRNEFLYLDIVSYRKYRTGSIPSEIDYCLDLYNKYMEKSIPKFVCKRLALMGTVKFIESRNEPFHWFVR